MRCNPGQGQVHFSAAGRFRQEIQQVRAAFVTTTHSSQCLRQMKLEFRVAGRIDQRVTVVDQGGLHIGRLKTGFAFGKPVVG